jgi:hypothetical protein
MGSLITGGLTVRKIVKGILIFAFTASMMLAVTPFVYASDIASLLTVELGLTDIPDENIEDPIEQSEPEPDPDPIEQSDPDPVKQPDPDPIVQPDPPQQPPVYNTLPEPIRPADPVIEILPHSVVGQWGTTDIVEKTTEGEAPEANPSADDSRPPSEPIASTDEQIVPLTSMPDDDGRTIIVVNTAIVTFSLILGGASLIFMRPRKSVDIPRADPSLPSSRINVAMGAVSIGFGALEAVLYVLSQYLISGEANAGTPWTLILAVVSVIQVACFAGLFIGKHLVAKKEKPRLNIRY